MSALYDLCVKGGPVMIAIMALSVLLYSRCFHLLLWLRAERRSLNPGPMVPPGQLRLLHRRQQEMQEAFRQQRIVLGAMIAAAPLLGLLGTVSGMTKTFDSLADRVGQKSMEGLAHGISEVLVATESGLAVALPALLLVYLAHRTVHRSRQRLNHLDVAAGQGRAP
jgi:biopolymer transport protein ExbB/TolQ